MLNLFASVGDHSLNLAKREYAFCKSFLWTSTLTEVSITGITPLTLVGVIVFIAQACHIFTVILETGFSNVAV